MVMASQAIATSSLVLRIFTLSGLVACMVVFLINNVTVIIDIKHLTLDTNGTKLTFKDAIAYRFVFSTAIIGAAYTLVQLPFAVYHVSAGKRMIRNGCLPEFDFYGDKVVSFLLSTGVGAGYAVSFELKSFLNDFFSAIADPTVPEIEESKASYDKFINRGIIATGLLSFGFVCMALVSVLSSVTRTGRKS